MKPIRNASGTLIDKVPIRKGTVLTTSLHYTNTAKSIWGADAMEFKPERWLDDTQDVPASAQAYPGYHHTMIFSDGPRTCLGKGFALTEMKVFQCADDGMRGLTLCSPDRAVFTDSQIYVRAARWGGD
jgi:hypothetical protein